MFRYLRKQIFYRHGHTVSKVHPVSSKGANANTKMTPKWERSASLIPFFDPLTFLPTLNPTLWSQITASRLPRC